MKKYILLIVSITFLLGCSSPKLAKRYKSSKNVWINSESVQNYVTVKTNTYKTNSAKITDKKKYKTIFDLSKKGQSEILKKVTLKDTALTISALVKELNILPKNNTSKSKPKKGLITHKTKFLNNEINKNIVFSVTRVFTSQGDNFKTINKVGDRIQYLDLGLEIINSNKLKFKNWNKFENDYATADFGSITSSKSLSAEISLGYDTSGSVSSTDDMKEEKSINNELTEISNSTISNTDKNEVLSNTAGQSTSDTNVLKLLNNKIKQLTQSVKTAASGKLSATDKLDESRLFKSQILKLSGTLNDNGFDIKQEGFEGINLKGNTTINVDLKYNGNFGKTIKFTNYTNLFKTTLEGTKPNSYDDLNKNFTNVFFPDINEDIKAKINYRFLYRRILGQKRGGHKYIPEYKHRVKYLFGEIKKDDDRCEEIILINKSDFQPEVYQILKDDIPLKINLEVLNFEKKEHAIEFLSWILFSNDLDFYQGTLNIKNLNNLQIVLK